jgi:hypothetical protein
MVSLFISLFSFFSFRFSAFLVDFSCLISF